MSQPPPGYGPVIGQVGPLPGYSDKTWIAAVLLSMFGWPFGLARFYLGYPGIGVAQLLTCGGCFVWALIDMVMIITGKVPDAQGRPLQR